jgi:hypothetical protein
MEDALLKKTHPMDMSIYVVNDIMFEEKNSVKIFDILLHFHPTMTTPTPAVNGLSYLTFCVFCNMSRLIL